MELSNNLNSHETQEFQVTQTENQSSEIRTQVADDVHFILTSEPYQFELPLYR